ncbi:hypothetical protein [Micromonospora carbonacea]|uniref:Uncharacterized protein n=1 Tax=Micromonospora carbonacea TaxID=47853 RepID=A0A1C5ADE7_9ACTN|nr:hypothetical protein [Micromonospora carbonacea]SCF43189.1 hypothetical protein GA0070563_112201 [Micromonospora carbonacea]
MNADQSLWDYDYLLELSRIKPDMTPDDIADHVLSSATKAQLRQYAAEHISDFVARMRRADAREAEQEATRFLGEDPGPSRQEALYEQWLANPEKHWHISNHRVREGFKRWAGDRFAAWHAAALRAVKTMQETDPGALHMFEGDWYPGGVMAHDRMRRREAFEEDLRIYTETISRDVRLETTRELLASFFALGDGRQVSWGDATVADHRQRIELLVRGMAGTAETAARHAAAIRMIEEAGVSRLGDLLDSPGRAA